MQTHPLQIPSAVETSGRILATVEESSALRVINQKANTPRLRSTIPNEGDVDVVTSKLNANASNENYLGAKFPDQNQVCFVEIRKKKQANMITPLHRVVLYN